MGQNILHEMFIVCTSLYWMVKVLFCPTAAVKYKLRILLIRSSLSLPEAS